MKKRKTPFDREGYLLRKQREAELILVCGDRNWGHKITVALRPGKYIKDDGQAIRVANPSEIQIIERELFLCKNAKFVFAGGAEGADQIAATIADNLHLRVVITPADWKTYGKKAGPIRNREQLKKFIATPGTKFGLAFHKNLEKSKGTKNMVDLMVRAGIPVKVVSK